MFIFLGARVILACRNKTKAELAREDIVNETNNENVVVKELDLSSLQSVRDFAVDFNASKRENKKVNNKSKQQQEIKYDKANSKSKQTDREDT